jgi:hypothetical protein
MDRKLSKDQEIQRLIQLSESARACLSREADLLKHRLDVPARLRSSLKENPTGWLFGSIGSGLAASLLFRRKSHSVERKKRTLPQAILGLTLTAARPLAKVWLTDQVKGYLARQKLRH